MGARAGGRAGGAAAAVFQAGAAGPRAGPGGGAGSSDETGGDAVEGQAEARRGAVRTERSHDLEVLPVPLLPELRPGRPLVRGDRATLPRAAAARLLLGHIPAGGRDGPAPSPGARGHFLSLRGVLLH